MIQLLNLGLDIIQVRYFHLELFKKLGKFLVLKPKY
jgi:hypothetical protein